MPFPPTKFETRKPSIESKFFFFLFPATLPIVRARRQDFPFFFVFLQLFTVWSSHWSRDCATALDKLRLCFCCFFVCIYIFSEFLIFASADNPFLFLCLFVRCFSSFCFSLSTTEARARRCVYVSVFVCL